MAGSPDDRRDLEALLARAPRVRALARALCADPGVAEDLAQEALVVALERPGAASAPLAWFRRVLERLAIDRGRADGARRSRERSSARREAQPSTLDLVARADLQRRLVEVVLELPEPYREALLERWFEERTPDAIARRLGIPASTVRTRLARGQALLRERLERREGRGWMAALAALGAGREGAPAASTTIATGGLLVATGTKLALVAVALAAGALWFAWPERGAAPREALEPSLAAAPVSAQAAPDERAPVNTRSELAAPARGPEPAHAAPPDEFSEAEAEALELEEGPIEAGTLRGIVLRGRSPIGSGTAWLARGNRFAPRDPREPWPGVLDPVPRPGGDDPVSTPIGPDGRFEFTGLRGSWYTLAVDAGEGVTRQMVLNALTGGAWWRTVVIVLGSAELSGHVHDAHGAPVEGARVVAYRDVRRNSQVRGFASSATTDATGVYALADLPAGSYTVGVRRVDHERDPNVDESVPLELALGQHATLDFGRARALPVWRGTLRARNGSPVPSRRLKLEDTASAWKRTELVVGGAFEFALAPGTYRVTTARVSDTLQSVEVALVELDEDGLERDLVLPGTRLSGLALDAATGAVWARTDAQSISIRPSGHDYPAAFTQHPLAADGGFVFDGLWPGEWVLGGWPLSARQPGGGEVVVTIREGDVELPLTVELAPPD